MNSDYRLLQSRAPLNVMVLSAMAEMPEAGGYSTKPEAGEALQRAIHASEPFRIDVRHATPSFCTSATYLVFLKVIERLRAESALENVGARTLERLAPPNSIESLFKDDGLGVWGRWNSNGPGTARLFHELAMGTNFVDWEVKLPGDFLKIFWTDEVGGRERGHSVIYLAERRDPKTADTEIQYWSSDQGVGYRKHWVSRSRIKHAIFSRLQRPEKLAALITLPAEDRYLKHCQTKDSSIEEALRMSGVKLEEHPLFDARMLH